MTMQMNDGRVTLHNGDCRDVLKGVADCSIDSVVTDPPYALVSISKRFGKDGSAPAQHGTDGAFARASAGFMGKQWDNGEAAFATTFWSEVLRVLKPGGHVLAFGGTRTYHRLACAIEDAGFEIRDQIGWAYGSGFPKSHNQHGDWEGWGTALKPAWEPIVLARKPLQGTVAANVLAYQTGALNIDGCRVGTEGETFHAPQSDPSKREGVVGAAMQATGGIERNQAAQRASIERTATLGRWPANLIHDGSDEVVAAFPEAGGQLRAVGPQHGVKDSKGIYGDFGARDQFEPRIETDKSAARFFYCAKASRVDRDAGLDHLPKKAGGFVSETSGQHITRRDPDYKPEPRANIHPTVKPTDLMRYLCRLVTPPDGVVLDPFMGSGSTGKAAVLGGFRFIGIEREEEYQPIAAARIAWAIGQMDRPDAPVPRKRIVTANDNDLFGAADAA